MTGIDGVEGGYLAAILLVVNHNKGFFSLRPLVDSTHVLTL
jgi:hypothetical protein